MALPVSSSCRPMETWPCLQPMEMSGQGQLFEYNPRTETLRLSFASPSRSALENPDNLVVAPDGSVIFCEDNAEGNTGAGPNEGERLVWSKSGQGGDIFTFALEQHGLHGFGRLGNLTRPSGLTLTTNQKQNEWAGAVFSPDGRWLFANIQTPGVTFAITGPVAVAIEAISETR